MEAIRVLLADDHVLFRKGIASLLSSRNEFRVVGEAGDGNEALEQARLLKPDVVLMDVQMPNCDGLQATKLLKDEMPDVRIVMLTVSDDDQTLFEAIKAGAQGYLLKNLEPEQLYDMLTGITRGEAPISRVMAAKILQEFAALSKRTVPAPAPVPANNLSAREKEVLDLVVRGASNKEIAAQLFITENTVKNHLRNILEKLHLENRVQAAAYAVREGIIKPPTDTEEPTDGDDHL